ncbi:hypothetical protein ABT040_02265 [Streptomyces sp. NPDC002688]|uniref:hypothetical protein n=1 Tax=Streptomyces sp. NPDC002688 TaxID=3154423 RepID=UPI0033348A88
MIRIVTGSRLERLEADATAAREQARQASAAAGEQFGDHVRELFAVTGRAEHAEAAASEVGMLLSAALEELAAAQEELLLNGIAIRRLREELAEARRVGRELTLLMHYGQPHTIYRSREDALADTATHGVPASGRWVPSDERPAAEVTWRIEAFVQEGSTSGFRRAFQPAPEPVGGVA